MKIDLGDKINKRWLHPTGKPVKKKKAKNQLAARDIPDLYENLEIDVRAVNDDNYRGCIMINTEIIPVAQFVKKAEDDLFYETKHDQSPLPSEDVPHATLLYGLLNNGNTWKKKVDEVLKGWKIDKVTIENVSFFDLGESKAVVGLLKVTDELRDGHERLTLLPHVNTFSEYHPHITLAYIKPDADVDKWVKALGKKYNGQVIATKDLNYGDKPEDREKKKKNDLSDALRSPVVHNCNEHELVISSDLIKAQNALEPTIKDRVLLQESNLKNAVARLEADIVNAVIQQLREGNIDEAEELISEAQEEQYIAELALIFAAFFMVLFPIYAAQLFAIRLSQFNKQGIFAMTDDVEEYIKISADNAARSHVNTVLRDLAKTVNESSEKVTRDEFIKLLNDRLNRRDKKVTDKLPDNPNQEDLVRAIDAGKFDEDPAYRLAREQAQRGQGLGEITKAIQEEYKHISEVRAKTIARHEASRVFTMSQYQADLQFLVETNNLDKAYKRLRSRSGNPCAVCNSLIEKTQKDPIPFKKNFADLGDEITANYKKPNGKMAVQKVFIGYEAIKSGNVHVNCNCEYELVIKNEDGTYQNSLLDFNAIGDGYNPYRDSDGRFSTGLKAVKIPKMKRKIDPDIKPAMMTQDQAEEATKDSAYKHVLYHGTSSEAAQAISEGGFQVSDADLTTRLYGDGIYFTPKAATAHGYAINRDVDNSKIVSVMINAKSVYDEDQEPSVADLVNEKMISEGVWDSPADNPSFAQFEKWHNFYREIANQLLDRYDAIIVPADDQQTGMVVVKDPSIIKIFEIGNSSDISRREIEKEMGL